MCSDAVSRCYWIIDYSLFTGITLLTVLDAVLGAKQSWSEVLVICYLYVCIQLTDFQEVGTKVLALGLTGTHFLQAATKPGAGGTWGYYSCFRASQTVINRHTTKTRKLGWLLYKCKRVACASLTSLCVCGGGGGHVLLTLWGPNVPRTVTQLDSWMEHGSWFELEQQPQINNLKSPTLWGPAPWWKCPK